MATKWTILPHSPEKVSALSRDLHVPPIVAQLLINRGIDTREAGKVFLECKLSQLHDPETMPGVIEAADRITRAIRDQKKIYVYGDYDVDGVCGASLLWSCLRLAGAKDVDCYIPKRVDEGYGLNGKALAWLKTDRQADMVITVDCGITAVAEAKLARQLGIELIITDHHTIGPSLPEADVLVHPKLPGSRYPFADLCGAGVALKLAWQICKSLGDGKRASPAMRDFLIESIGLVAMATIADVVPIRDENRILVYHGMDQIRYKPTIGMQALKEVCELKDKALTTHTIGFGLAPRINAAGRMESAMSAFRMLTTDDLGLAREHARRLNECNKRRQEMERMVVTEAREMVESLGPTDNRGAIVVGRKGWHSGVIGIVASRLAELYHRPAIVVSLGDELGQGSGRSINKFNLYNAINACSDCLIGFGGHAAAAGVKVAPDRFDEFAKRFDEHCQKVLTMEQRQKELLIDDELVLDSLTLSTVKWIEQLEPHGTQNAKPLLLAQNVRLTGPPKFVGENGIHVQLQLAQHSNKSVKGVAFGMAERFKSIQSGAMCNIVFSPGLNHWRGQTNVELQIRDIRFTSTTSTITPSHPHIGEATIRAATA